MWHLFVIRSAVALLAVCATIPVDEIAVSPAFAPGGLIETIELEVCYGGLIRVSRRYQALGHTLYDNTRVMSYCVRDGKMVDPALCLDTEPPADIHVWSQ